MTGEAVIGSRVSWDDGSTGTYYPPLRPVPPPAAGGRSLPRILRDLLDALHHGPARRRRS